MASPAPSSDAPPPAADSGAADDTSIAEEHTPTDAGGDSPSADDADNSSDADEEDDGEETNDVNEAPATIMTTTTTPNCSALLGWLRTFPVLEDHLASEDDDAASCNFGDRDVVA